MLFLAWSSWARRAWWQGALSSWRIQFLVLHRFSCFQNVTIELSIDSLSLGDVFSLHHNTMDIKRNYEHALDCAESLLCLLWSWRWRPLSLCWLLLHFRVVPVKPTFVISDALQHERHIIRSTLMGIFIDANVMLFLLSCQQVADKLGRDMPLVQFRCKDCLHRTDSIAHMTDQQL